MQLARGRVWRLSLSKGRDAVVLGFDRDQLGDDVSELRDLRIEIPLARWNTLVKLAEGDRKLLGGVLLDYATHKDHVAHVVANDRLLVELQRLVRDATVALIEAGLLVLQPVERGEEE